MKMESGKLFLEMQSLVHLQTLKLMAKEQIPHIDWKAED